jgi:hypothetical protein
MVLKHRSRSSPTAFDADYAGRRLIISINLGSQGGRLTISPDTHCLYTPPADFAGTEAFVYAVGRQYGTVLLVR